MKRTKITNKNLKRVAVLLKKIKKQKQKTDD